MAIVDGLAKKAILEVRNGLPEALTPGSFDPQPRLETPRLGRGWVFQRPLWLEIR